MTELEKARAAIDEIDREMAALFTRRMAAAADVAAYKKEAGLAVFDAAREAAVLEKNVARLQQPELREYYADFLQHLMDVSKQYQTRLLGRGTVAYQGAEGGFGHQVAQALFPHAAAQPAATFAAVFALVEEGAAAYGVVPFENSGTGDVSGVLDLCYSHSCYITAVYDLPVVQNLLGLPGAKLADIQTVYSHPQALEQSKRFLDSLGAEQRPFANTASAARFVAEQKDKTIAAVASLAAGKLYGLETLAAGINTQAVNTTRFIVIEKQPPAGGDRFSLLVTIQNRVGGLAQVIEAIAAEGFDMESIKSRPMPGRPWEYYFYIELVGAPAAEETRVLLGKIGEVCLSVRMLGMYRRQQGEG